MEKGTLIKLDTEWLQDWGYSVDDIHTGDRWIWAINHKGEIVYFEKENIGVRDSDDYPTKDDEVYLVEIERTFPFVYIKILRGAIKWSYPTE